MADVLQSLSNDLAAAVERIGPSVVRIEGRRRLPATGIVWSADGLIVTAHHVVTRDENIHVGLSTGQTVPAALVGRDPSTDIALLRADLSGLPVPTWAEADSLKIGQLVLALGRPGETVQATLGVISALAPEWRTPAGGAVDRYVNTDIVMYPGFSGGPLVGASGAVLGLNTSALLREASVALPTPTLRRVIETLAAHGRVRRGYLGIGTQPVRLPDALAAKVEQETGLMLVSVESDSPAERGGLMMGDVIIGLDGQAVRHMDDLLGGLSGDRIGKALPVRVVRGGEIKDLKVTVGERE